MTIRYQVGGQPQQFELEVEDDLDSICAAIAREVGERHPELARNPNFWTRICDGALNALADDSDEILLEDLTG
jgi:hypothetical protein